MKKTKGIRQILTGIIAVAMVIFLNGCGNRNLGAYDTNVPPEQQCTLVISKYLKVVSFDDKKVEWGGNDLGGGYGGGIGTSAETTTTISIPAGKHTLLVNYRKWLLGGIGGMYTEYLGIPFTTDNLVAGKTYYLNPLISDTDQKVSVFITQENK